MLQRYKMPHDLEVAAFISAMLSFGRRDLFLPKIEFLLDLADKEGGPFYWLSTGLHKKTFPPPEALPEASFYRFYSHQDIHLLFCRLEEILSEAPSLGEYFRLKYQEVQVMTEKDGTESKEKSCIKKSLPICLNLLERLFLAVPLFPKEKTLPTRESICFSVGWYDKILQWIWGYGTGIIPRTCGFPWIPM